MVSSVTGLCIWKEIEAWLEVCVGTNEFGMGVGGWGEFGVFVKSWTNKRRYGEIQVKCVMIALTHD